MPERLPSEMLILFVGQPDLAKLCVTWPTVGSRSYDSSEDLREAWERVSGVYAEDIDRLEPILFENGLCGPGGIVDADVVTYLRSVVMEEIEKGLKRSHARRR